jgi:hypothetical protein
VHKILSKKTKNSQKRAAGMTQGVGLDFKPPYWKKKKKRRRRKSKSVRCFAE